MATRGSERSATRRQSHRPAATAACEACRKMKMRCIRPNALHGFQDSVEPCDRCRRNNRTCNIPSPRPLGRKPGSVGRYHGLEKAYRKMQTELKKAHASGNVTDVASASKDGEALHLLNTVQGDGNTNNYDNDNDVYGHADGNNHNNDNNNEGTQSNRLCESRASSAHASPAANVGESPVTEQIQHESRDPVSNPLALLADASDAAQTIPNSQVDSGRRALSPGPGVHRPQYIGPGSGLSYGPDNHRPVYDDTGHGELHPGTGISRHLLNRPGYISLGLQLGRDSLENGLDALFTPSQAHSLEYFRPPDANPPRDVGPDLDPVELGLVSIEEAYALFPIYFTRLHSFNGILDPVLHTVDYVRSQSALLFTWILALTAQFDQGSASIAKRLRLHGEKLSRHVHTCGYKSVEIVQGYYISLLSATPARTLWEERSWLYTMYAFGVAAELGLDQGSRRPEQRPTHAYEPPSTSDLPDSTVDRQFQRSLAPNTAHSDLGRSHISTCNPVQNPTYVQRMARNRERTWLRILLWERANSAACGRMNAFPETELTRNIESWWMHPLADSSDKHTCAFILLRCHLAALHAEIRRQTGVPHPDRHWVRNLIKTTLEPWETSWLPPLDDSLPPSERLPTIHLYYVYIHNRLWTLSFALHASNGNHDLSAIREDCFEAAVHCCEVAVCDLQTIGEPLYCMLAPTWAMISYAAVLALRLFPDLHGPRPGYQVELLALLSQVALQLERAGSTPSHRLGIAALLGQHLLMILRTKAIALVDAFPIAENQAPMVLRATDANPTASFSSRFHGTTEDAEIPSETRAFDPLVSTYDPFLTAASLGTDNDFTGDGFADLFRELFGPSFGSVF